jgi:hypothetical protein
MRGQYSGTSGGVTIRPQSCIQRGRRRHRLCHGGWRRGATAARARACLRVKHATMQAPRARRADCVARACCGAEAAAPAQRLGALDVALIHRAGVAGCAVPQPRAVAAAGPGAGARQRPGQEALD